MCSTRIVLAALATTAAACPRSPSPKSGSDARAPGVAVAAAPAAAPAPADWIWEHPQPQGSPLVALAGDSTALHAVGVHGAAILSTDGGTTWSVSPTGTVADLRGVAVTSTRLPGTRAVIVVGAESTILRSIDGGRSFAPIPAPVRANFVDIAVDPAGVAYVVAETGAVLRSLDGGASFEVPFPAPATVAPMFPGIIAIAAPADGVVVLSDGSGLRRSTDGGATFVAPATPPMQTVQRFFTDGAGVLYGTGGTRVQYDSTLSCGSCVDASYETLSLFRSRDHGNTWEERVLADAGATTTIGTTWRVPSPVVAPPAPPPDLVHVGWGGFHPPALRPRWLAAAGAAVGKDVYLVELGALSVSRDGGTTFHTRPVTDDGARHAGALIATAPDTLFSLGGDSTVTRSRDRGATWQRLSTSATTGQNLFAIAATATGRAFAVGMEGFLLARDASGVWHRVPTSLDHRLNDIAIVDGDHVVVVGDSGVVLTSSDGGRSFVRRTSATDAGLYTVWTYGTMVLAAGSDGTVVRSLDRGVTWRKLAGLTHDAGIALWGSSAHDIYLVTVNGQELRSTDGGDTWTDVGASLSGVITGVWGSGPDDVYLVGWEGRLFHSTNHGVTWKRIATGTKENLNVIWGTGPDDIYAGGGESMGTRGILLHSTDRGRTWRETPIPTAATIYALGGNARDVFVIGAGAQILRRGRAVRRRVRDRRHARPLSGDCRRVRCAGARRAASA